MAVTQKQLLLGKNEEVRDVEAITIRGRKGGADGIEKDYVEFHWVITHKNWMSEIRDCVLVETGDGEGEGELS